jgi:hypothetical protein
MEQGQQAASFARARNPDSSTVEVRVDMRKETVLWLDAMSMAEDRTRGALINEILGEWAAKQAHVHMVVNRVVGSNPSAVESAGAPA